ncbi:MAG: hypothetical protein PVH61_04035 [Candidatus Aminicenantes bacterium]
MPIFILHFSDYLVCIPIWWFQRRNILKKSDKSKKLISSYKESILFKHEMLYFQMPGLHKIMIAFARNKEIGIQKSMEEIEYIYWFTFQKKQAQKAAAALLKDHEIAHHYIHFLLKKNNHLMLETLAQKTRLARLYLLLFEAEYKIDQIMYVYQEIPTEKGYQFNDEMVITLKTVYHLLTTTSLKDFYKKMNHSIFIAGLTHDISYFSSLEGIIHSLKRIKEDLEKIEAIERFETKRSFMNEQKENLEALAIKAEEVFYEPFQTIWKKALMHCSGLVAQEVKLLQGSAVLSIDLKNREILASDENRALYFEIINKGQELAANISIDLQAEDAGFFIIGDTVKKLPVIESGSRKEISFDISAGSPMETTVKGTITFSDRTREGKQVPFSFPITVLKKSAVFREIKNPYIIGQALKGGVSLFFGRDERRLLVDFLQYRHILPPQSSPSQRCGAVDQRAGKRPAYL